jgi:hypothetical protein
MRWSLLPCLLALTLAGPARSQDDAGRRWPVTGVTAPGTELALELYVSISPAVVIGTSDHGMGIIAPAAADGSRYVRTTPRFHAPLGPHDWLNKTSFVGTITPSPQGGAVIIRVFKVL